MGERERVGPYVVYRRIGDGGMGEVFLGQREQLGASKWVAVKTIHGHLARREDFVKSFLDEARVSMALNHPNVVQVFDLGRDERESDGRLYLAMEYVNGENLDDLIQDQPIHPALAAKIIALASEGLHHAHEARDARGEALALVHRDVSPHNIFLSYDGHIKVADFGIAKAEGRHMQTATGHIKGKVSYMSPEQARAKVVDRRTDIFALGAVLWELLTGRVLFLGRSDTDTLIQILEHDVEAPSKHAPDVPAELDAIVLKALAFQPEDRHQSAAELAEELEEFLVQERQRVPSSALAKLVRVRCASSWKVKQGWLRGQMDSDLPPAPIARPTAFAHTMTPAEVETKDEAVSDELSLAVETAREVAPASRSNAALRLWGLAFVMALALVAGVVGIVNVMGDTSAENVEPLDEASQPLLVREEAADEAEASDDTILELGVAPPEGSEPEGSEVESAEAQERAESAEAESTEPESTEAESTETESNEAPQELEPVAQEPRVTMRRTTMREAAPAETPVRGTGLLSVITQPWCNVRINGRDHGQTPLQLVEVPAGSVRIQLQPRGRGPWQEERANVPANGRRAVRYSF